MSAILALNGKRFGSWARTASQQTVTPITVLFVLLFVSAWFIIGPVFVSSSNLGNILVRAVALGFVAIGQTFVILGGSFDLSVPWVVSLSAVTAAVVMQGRTAWLVPGILAALTVSALVGLANGLLVTKLRVNAFIATLAMSLVLEGLLSSSFSQAVGAVPVGMQAFAYQGIGPVPWAAWLFFATAVGAWWILRSSRFGAHLYAVGGSRAIARQAGVRSDRVLVAAHIMCSVLSGVAGVFLASRLGAGSTTIGPDGVYDLYSIAAVVLGGTALLGGEGGVVGSVIAVFVLATLDNIFTQLSIDPYVIEVVRGSIMIVAVVAYGLRLRKRAQA